MTRFWGNEVVEKHQAAPGYSGAIAVQYNFLDRIGIRIEPGFERKGSDMKSTAYDINGVSYKMKQSAVLDYCSIPVLARFSFGKSKNFFVNAGPYAAYLTRFRDFITLDDTPKTEIHYGGRYKNFDFGVSAGAGARMVLKEKIVLSAEVRDNLGLRNISDKPVFGNGTIKNNSLSLIAGVAYKI